MKPGTPRDPLWIGAMCRMYAGALWLYPPSHRRRWGAEMRLAFRDRCRESARAGRGPINVLFAELIPDLAATVGSEHFDAAYLETNPMKRLLYVLIATFVVVVMLHSQVTPALDAMHAWWRQRQEVAYQQTYSAHLESLAKATEQQRSNSHDDVTAAILFWNATSDKRAAPPTDWGSEYLASQRAVANAISPAANNALRDQADAAFARALNADDRWALWLAVHGCPARPKICAKEASLARLHQIDSDNGAVWLLDMRLAEEDHDPVRERAALAGIARSTRFDLHDGDAMRAMLSAFDRAPVPSRLIVDTEWVHATPAASAVLLASQLAHGSELDRDGYMSTFLDQRPLANYCRASEAQIHAERQADCRAGGKLTAEQGSNWVGYLAWIRNSDPGELTQVRAAFRQHLWQNGGASSLMAPLNSETALLAWKKAWLAGGNEIDVNRRLMQQQGIALNAPSSYQLHADAYNPATF